MFWEILSPRIAFGGLGTPGPRVNTWMSSLAASNAVLKLENGGKMTVSWTSDVLNKRYQYYINIIPTLYQHYIIYQLCQLDSRTSQVFHMSTRSALPIPAEAWMLPKCRRFNMSHVLTCFGTSWRYVKIHVLMPAFWGCQKWSLSWFPVATYIWILQSYMDSSFSTHHLETVRKIEDWNISCYT